MSDFEKVVVGEKLNKNEHGAWRGDSSGKGRYDLLPVLAKRRVARHFENGAKKYDDRNWEKGLNVMRYFDSAERHLDMAKGGAQDEDHLAAVAWNILCVIETIERIELGLLPKELDDRPEPVWIRKEQTDE